MFAIFIDAVRAFVSAVTDARSLALSNLALRHRPGVLERQGAMPHSHDTDPSSVQTSMGMTEAIIWRIFLEESRGAP